jgi:hypothetical protein
MEKITDILFSEVETESGKKLGRVFEIRSEGDPDHGISNDSRNLDYFLCGEGGLLERLGFKERQMTCIPVSEIREFAEGKIIVRDEAWIGSVG